MKTDALISLLAADTRMPRAPKTQLALALVPALVLAVAALWLTLGFRADLVPALASPATAARLVLALALGAAATRIALVLARPEGRGLVRLWPLVAVAVAALGLLVWAYLATPGDARQMAIAGKTLTTCLLVIPLLSILPVAAILAMLRRGAPTAPALAGLAAGLGGGGLAAAVYALHCIEDSPLFYVTWYSVAILGVAMISTLIGTRILRW